MCTVESGSSTQSTGTSSIQPGALGEHQHLGVEEPAGSSTIGSSRSATSRRIALNPHWASLKRAAREERRMRL